MMPAVHKLESAFSEIARTRMADVPIINPALRVEAVGFRQWQGRWIGVLITPWTINLVLLPGQDAPLIPLGLDEIAVWNFPSGAYEFMGMNEPAIGVCHICSLISPVLDFATHDEALAVALEVSVALFADSAEKPPTVTDTPHREGETVSPIDKSRRNFCRMSFTGN